MDMPRDQPTIELILAPAAGGKTRALVERLRTRRGRSIALVPDATKAQALRQRLGGARGLRVRQFYDLAREILDTAHLTPPLLDQAARLTLVRQILFELMAEGQLPTYGRVAAKPGFVAAVAALLEELGNADVTTDAFAAAAATPHDAELAAVYERYARFQAEHAIADLPRVLRLARSLLGTRPDLLRDIDMLAVDGFDQFAPVQLSLLAEIAQRVGCMVVTLTGGPAPRPAFRRFARTLAELRAMFTVAETYLPPAPTRCAAALHQIEATLFELDPPAAPINAAGAVTLVEAPDCEREVRAVLRHVQRLLAGGDAPESIALLFRSGALYVKLLREVAAEYGLPLAIEDGLPLAEAPPVAALLGLLRLPLNDFPRRPFVEVLGSPYLTTGDRRWTIEGVDGDPTSGQHPLSIVQHLGALARYAGITGGLAHWRAALNRLAALEMPEPDEAGVPPIYGAEAAALRQALDELAAWLAPPLKAQVAEYTAWLRARRAAIAIGPEDGPFFARDAAALEQFDEVLAGLERTATLLQLPPQPFGLFWSSLERAVNAAHYSPPEQSGVIATTALAARGRTWAHVCLLGLSEGEFPQPLPEPALYSRSERRALAERGVSLPAPDPGDERTIFYEAVTRACQTLLLSRTRLDEKGTPLPRSPYLTALLRRLDGVETRTVAAGSVPNWDEAASPHERALALAELLSQESGVRSQKKEGRKQKAEGKRKKHFILHPFCCPSPVNSHRSSSIKHHVSSIHRLSSIVHRLSSIVNEYPAWPHVVRARRIEAWREGLGAYGLYEGLIEDAEVQALVAANFGPEHQWSAAQFNDYRICPFRFAAGHVLGLQPRADPAQELDGAQRGLLLHAVLARAAKRWRQAELPLTSAHAEAVLGELETAANEVLGDAPERYGFAPGAFWQWEQDEIHRRLRGALRRLLADDSDWAAFAPLRIEQSFGGRRPPLEVATPDGPVRVRGRIDRIDQRPDGALAVVDYKSSSTPRSNKDALEGRDLQLALYVLAAEQLLRGRQVDRAAFVHLGSGKRGGVLRGGELQQALAAARAAVASTVAAVRATDFRVRPSGDCPDYCEFVLICRRNLAKRAANADTLTR